jgi:hypothetical protein
MTGFRRLDGIHGQGTHGIGKFTTGGHQVLSGAGKVPLSPIQLVTVALFGKRAFGRLNGQTLIRP